MKSFFEYCDSQDKKFYETSLRTAIGQTEIGKKSLGSSASDVLTDIMEFIISCIQQDPIQAKAGLKRMALNNQDLENKLESIFDKMNLGSLSSKIKNLSPKTEKDSEINPSDMKLSNDSKSFSDEEDEMDHMA